MGRNSILVTVEAIGRTEAGNQKLDIFVFPVEPYDCYASLPTADSVFALLDSRLSNVAIATGTKYWNMDLKHQDDCDECVKSAIERIGEKKMQLFNSPTA